MSLTQINKAGLDEIALDHVFTIGASGSSAYTFQGEGLNGTVNNPTLYLTRGKTYRFENGSGGHPIRIQSTSGASGTAYNTGVTNNAGSGTVIVEVQHDAPDVLYYQCTSHAAMNGILYVTGALADGSVTEAKLATNAVTEYKIANGAVTTTKIPNDNITTAKLADGAVQGDKIASSGIAAGKLAADSVSNTNIIDGNVTASELGSNAVTTAKIQDGAVTAAKIASGVTDLVSDTSPQLGGDLQSNGNDIDFADNDKAIFGAGNDLEIHHRSSDSDSVIMHQNENGHLRILSGVNGNGGIKINNRTDNSAYIHCNNEGSVDLYHNGNKKLETTSIGANVTGSLLLNTTTTSGISSSADDLVIGSISDTVSRGLTIATTADCTIRFADAGDNAMGRIQYLNDTDIMTLHTANTKRLQIDADGLKFGSDTAAANALDDYEEGTYTATVYWSSSNTTGGHTNTTTLTGRYTKVGRMVEVGFIVYPGNYNSGSNCWITKVSLPFAVAADKYAVIAAYSGRGNYGGTLNNSSYNRMYAVFSATHNTIAGYVTGNGNGAGYYGHYSGDVASHAYMGGIYETS